MAQFHVQASMSLGYAESRNIVFLKLAGGVAGMAQRSSMFCARHGVTMR
jgi:hypothetical protein